ncbi:hypothetical protein ACFLIM_40790 [Nonomuraea sp. M3C6]|uniref:Sel1 repeat family protein n=1 Tax=Nonomuraea marmarensis TaxID=3351344 RepID=A0ABW7AQ96_9ACTN
MTSEAGEVRVALGRKLVAAVVLSAAVFNADGAAATVDTPPAPVFRADTARPVAVPTATAAEEPVCMRLKGAKACVGPDGSDRPGITIEDTADDKLHPAVEYYLNGYLGTKYVIHNLGRAGETRGSREIGKVVTFRAAVYRGNRRVKYGRWKTVRNLAKYPVKRETRVTPAAVRARAEACTSTKGAALTCFAEQSSFVFACDTSADEYQARAEYFVAGDPTARFEIHQLAGLNTCGKAEHGDLAVSMYRAAVFDHNRRVASRLYKYN